ncbi:ankyrin repeat, SAM and basic leucine zipper domain-containing protein 1-like [Glandiceps talaboti]
MATVLGFRPAGDEEDEYDDDDYDFNGESYDKETHKGSFTIGQPDIDTSPPRISTDFRRSPPDLRKRSNSFGRKKRSLRQDKQGSPLVVEDLRSAVIRGNVTEVQSFIDKGVPVDSILKTGWTALMYAASFGSSDVVKLLLDRGADPNFHKDRYTVLMSACSCNKEDESLVLNCVTELLQHGAHANAHDRYHMTPLMYASKFGYPSVVQKLINHQAGVDKQDIRGWTALIWAASKGQTHVTKVLLQSNADPNKAASDGLKAHDVAYANSFIMLSELLEFAANPSQPSCRVTYNSMSNGDVEPNHTDVSPVRKDSPASNNQHYIRYGDLELFLCGLELGHLVPLFQDHQITFPAFLRMNDHDLEKIGVRQLGYRKKILEAIQHVHKKEWEPTSLTSQNLRRYKILSVGECSAILNNISKHCEYISSTVGYIKDQMKSSSPAPNQKPGGSNAVSNHKQDSVSLEVLSGDVIEAMTQVKVLHRELGQLKSHVIEAAKLKDDAPVDLIEDQKDDLSQSKHYVILPWIGLSGVLVFGFIWFKTSLLK